MTRILIILVLLCTSLIGCNSPQVASYMKRPDLNSCITRFDGKMSCNGIVTPIPPKMRVFKTQVMAIKGEKYCSDLEFSYYKCLKFGDCDWHN